MAGRELSLTSRIIGKIELIMNAIQDIAAEKDHT